MGTLAKLTNQERLKLRQEGWRDALAGRAPRRRDQPDYMEAYRRGKTER